MDRFDLLVVGGGINGAAIARDAVGRGLSVLLVEKDDLASHTSSASSKLIHGGLRYLEQYDFRLVRESLAEREILLRTAPHLVRPLRFVLPDPAGGRPWWMIRMGLRLYDLLAGRSSLGWSKGVKADDPIAAALRPGFRLATYWDAWVDDSRLVVLNALDATERGAEIATRTELLAAAPDGDGWTADLSGGRRVTARMIVNAAGPWVAELLEQRLGQTGRDKVRLVKGSHILVPRLWEGEQAYILQQEDGRVVFALPFGEHSLLGTTDVPIESGEAPEASADEIAYLCAAANLYFRAQTSPADVVWAYSGVRSLHDDGSAQAKDISRDYHLAVAREGPPLLSVFGGKITTARALASEALDRLGVGGFKFTMSAPLPGGDVDAAFTDWLVETAARLPADMLERMARAYGTRLRDIVGTGSQRQLGRHFGAGLYEAEVRHLMTREFARTADDVLWRRSKLGLKLTPAQQAGLAKWMSSQGPS
jgi:glycerol-3-phosphate dehydrogenase